MYMAVASAPPPSANTTAALASGMSGYVSDSVQKRLMTFYPPPYGFAAGMSGHDCGCGGSCGGCGHDSGMGQLDLSSLFASGTDISGWGWPEWSIVGLGAFAVASAVSNVATAGRKVSRKVSRSVGSYKRRSKQKKALQQQLSEL